MKRTYEDVLKDIKERPSTHRHNFEGLQTCCMIDGMLDLRLIDAHSDGSLGSNGGRNCDVSSGPCSCGAWH